MYSAFDLTLNSPVAVKVINKSNLNTKNRRNLVQREIYVLSAMNSPHIGALFRLAEDSKRIYLVMELCGGKTLSGLAKKRPRDKFENEEAVHLFAQIANGVQYIHSKGFCHRDLKMTNILVDTKGVAKIVDFGFASETFTLQKMYCGTPSYMSPEILKKIPYDGKSADIWSLGVVLFKMLTGQYAFGGKHFFVTI